MNMSRKTLLSLATAGSMLFSASAFSLNPPGGGGDMPNPCTSDCGFEVGPDPSLASLRAERGPFSISEMRESFGDGFGRGTVYYPEGTSGELGAVVVMPGFVSPETSVEWWGQHLASHGFVTMVLGTQTPVDLPTGRERQINAALDFLIAESESADSPISSMVDRTRVGVVGWSMGGGGALRVAQSNRLSAVIPLAPWDTRKDFSTVDAPTLMISCENDIIAPNRNHSHPFWESFPDNIDKAYVEIAGKGHFCANGGDDIDPLLSTVGVSWMKLHLDKDQRYQPFLCDQDFQSNQNVETFRSNCPF